MPKRPPAQTAILQTLTIHDIGPQGDGIARENGYHIYVHGALPQDIVEARVTQDKDGTHRGIVQKIITPSPFRVPETHACGSCTMQHSSVEFYRQFKQDIVKRVLEKAGTETEYLPPFFGHLHTRRRATFAVSFEKGKMILGYNQRRTHEVAEVNCPVLHPELLQWRDKVSPYLKKILNPNKTYDVFLQTADGVAEMVITGPLKVDMALREYCVTIVNETGLGRIGWRAKIFDTPEMLIEQKPLIARFGKLSVHLPLNAFLQPTADGQQALVNSVLNALPPSLNHMADLFCGCGTFSGPLLERARNVDSFDITGVDALRKAAGAYPLKTFERDLFKRTLMKDELKKYDAVVFDPPRAGCKEQVTEIAKSKVGLVVGVSCNPSTFTRDARILIDGGFKLETLQIVDQFVWSHHVEVVGKFVR